MTFLRLVHRNAGLAPVVLALGLALTIGGCSRDRGQVAVDFTKTVPVGRPGTQEPGNSPLRVAVAAMIFLLINPRTPLWPLLQPVKIIDRGARTKA